MARFFKKREQSKGLAPGSLVFIGNKKVENIRIRVIDYDKTNLNTDFRASFNRHINIRCWVKIYLNLRLRFTESSQEIDLGNLFQGTALSMGL